MGKRARRSRPYTFFSFIGDLIGLAFLNVIWLAWIIIREVRYR